MISWTQLILGYHHPLTVPCSGSIEQPGLYGILGPNGCGKTTLFKTWLSLIKPFSGVFQTQFHHPCHPKNFHVHLGYVPQRHHINKHIDISVYDLISQGLGPNPPPQSEVFIDDSLREWELFHVAQKSFHELSLGQQVRCLIARAMIAAPDMLFLDEPLASLDPKGQDFLITKLKELKNNDSVYIWIIDHHLKDHHHHLDQTLVFERIPDSPLCTFKVD